MEPVLVVQDALVSEVVAAVAATIGATVATVVAVAPLQALRLFLDLV